MTVSYVWKHEANHVWCVIASLIEGHQKKVDFSQYHCNELFAALEMFGIAQE